MGVRADKVYLIGFMASGKSSVARALARRLDWRALDIDDLIEKHEQLPVAEIFARRGESHFRAVERNVLLEQIGRRHLVVATGGGKFVDPQNRAAIQQDGVTIWLDVPIDRLIARIRPDGRRPLAADRSEFERLFYSRRDAYQQAHHRIDAGRGSVDAVVEELVDWLER